MRPLRFALPALSLLLAAFFVGRRAPFPPSSAPPPRVESASTPRIGGDAHPLAAPAVPAASHDERRERLAYAQGWNRALQPDFAAFREWTERYRQAPTAEARAALEAEGLALSRARRIAMRRMIVRDPERALAETVPAIVRQSVPAAIRAELEERIAGQGEYVVIATGAPRAGEIPGPTFRRRALIGGNEYTAHVYGRKEGWLAREGVSLHGIALDRQLALHASPVRLLEAGERPASSTGESCPVSDAPIAPVENVAAAESVSTRIVEAAGRLFEFCGEEGMVEAFEQQLLAAEDAADARRAAPATAALAPTAWTIGNKRVLVLRVDFSDLPGEPLAVGTGQSLMDGAVRSALEENSYGQTSLTTTVTPKIYRLPLTAASYANEDKIIQLHTDARAAAAVDYTVADFDRIIVVFANIGTSRFPGSRITAAGYASVGTANVWINGAFNLLTLVHELGHTYGLKHANRWQVSDGNPISEGGRNVEYGDPFDAMGGSGGNVTRDARSHFAPWAKNHLGWLPDQAVKTVTASGTYRIYRFDHRDANTADRPLALRVFRDGVRWYWIGQRQNYGGNGAYVTWGFNSRQHTALLDFTTGSGVEDSVLAVGGTFADPAYGITIRVVGRAGSEPAQYLDVEVTLPPTAPPNVVTAWGRDGASFSANDSGDLPSPVPETYVPMGLVNIRQLALGDRFGLALKADGTVVAWGNLPAGQPAVPANLTNVASIAAGGGVSGVVKNDGTVQLWGDGTNGVTTVPAGLANVRRLAIGHTHALALKADGTVVAWGSNASGQTNVPANLANVVAIAASERLSVALRADGTVAHWGVNSGSLPAGLTGVTAIAASSRSVHVLALKNDGTVVGWGSNGQGQTTIPAGLSGVSAIAAGGFHSLALKSDGSVVAWGYNAQGATNVPPSMPRSFAVAASEYGSFALVGGQVFLTAQPQNKTTTVGSSVTLSVGVNSGSAATYQWRKNGSPIAGATSATLTFAAATEGDTGSYDVLVTDSGSTVTSVAAQLNVFRPLVVATRLETRMAELGSRVTLTVATTGGGPLTYQWRRNGNVITGATTSTLTFNSVTTLDTASYTVTLTDGNGAITAPIADLSVVPAARIANLSIRSAAGTGAQTLIVGFAVGGPATTGTKPLLIRAVGPALGAFGVAGTLADPRLEIYRGTVRISENDNWGGHPQVISVGTQVGAFALGSVTSRDAALYSPSIVSDSYTTQISGVGNASGVVLAEIYDASPATTFSVTTPRLVNVSARTLTGSGADILIAGFVVAGSTPKTILFRAVGPTLGGFGVTGVLVDPRMELYRGETKISENDDWGLPAAGVGEFTAAFTAVGAFQLPAGSKDSALLRTLEPGNYTVQVSGVGGTSGVALVEIYEMR